MKRRQFIQAGCAALAAWALPAGAGAVEASLDGYPLELQTLLGRDLRFGTGVYAYRSGQDLPWLLSEARALGLTGARVEYPRGRVEASRDDRTYDPANYREPNPEIARLLKQSGLEILFVLDGHRVNERRQPVDFPRNPDGSVDGQAAAPGFANYVRFAYEHTRGAASAYELWNEAFNTLFDKHFGGKGFGPGGSKQSADNYAAMMLPAMKFLKSRDKSLPVLIEGNYWNAERSMTASPGYQELARMADYAVIHPYGYKLHFYEKESGGQRAGTIRDVREHLARINPRLAMWYTEYNVSPKDMGLAGGEAPPLVQAKAVLRATLLHLSHGVTRMDVFCMYYPSIDKFSLIGKDRVRKPSWHAFQRLMAALSPGARDGAMKISRQGVLPGGLRDLAVATPKGASYLIWQETSVERFPVSVAPLPATVSLSQASGRPLKLAGVLDPITGREPGGVNARVQGAILSLALSVPDYPLLCRLEG